MTDKIVKEAQERYALSLETESYMRDEMLEDVRFEAGDQWPSQIKRMRETDPDGARPCLTINMSRKHKNALLNDLRRNMPQIKVLPVDDNADIETAKILNGLLRHIQVVSDADIAYDTAADHQVTQGLGYFRIMTEVIDEEKNEQEVRISQIINPFSVRMDCYADHPAGADAEWCFIEEDMPRKKFKLLYPDAELADFSDVSDEAQLWFPDDETVRIAEYFCIKENVKKSMRVDDDEYSEDEYWEKYAGDEDRPQPEHVERKTRKCMWYKLAGGQILDERELPCSYIPVVRVVGEERRYDNKRDFRGIIRDLRDPQRMYNYNKSAYVERVALSPKAPYIGPAEAFEGHEDDWSDANTANRPYLPYNQLAEDGVTRLDPPKRQPPTPVEVALLNAMVQDAEDMRQVSGQNQAGFGESGNETSGKAINARRQEQDTNTFHFVDNLSRSIKHAGRIIVEMIPKVYDTRRVVRILGEDDTPDFATFDPSAPRAMTEVEDLAGDIQRIYNPGLGRYDVRVVVGPSYATKAEEGAERLSQLIQAAPDLMAIAGDLLFKNMDIPGAEDLSERMKAMLPPQIQQLDEAKKNGQAKGMQQAEMVRQQMIAEMTPMIEQLQAALEEAGQENDELQNTLEQMKLQLADKQAEQQLKAAELNLKKEEVGLKHQSEMAGHEADVATAYIQAQSQPAEMQPREHAPSAPSEQIASPVDTSEPVADEDPMVEQLAQVIQAIQQAQEQQGQQIHALEARMDATDTQRAEMAQIAAGLLSGKLSDQEAAAQLGGRLN